MQGGRSIPEYAPTDTEINRRSLKLRVLIPIYSAQDKVFSCLLFTVLFTIISIISSTILKSQMGLVPFLDMICSHEFIGRYPLFYFCCAGMSKQNHWEQRPICSANTQIHRTRRIETLQEVTWVTDGGMLYQIVENELYNSL